MVILFFRDTLDIFRPIRKNIPALKDQKLNQLFFYIKNFIIFENIITFSY